MSKVIDIYPANDFKVVAENAVKILDVGIVIGYDKDGNLEVFGGGMINGKQPVCKDWLWMVEQFNHNLIAGEYGHEG